MKRIIQEYSHLESYFKQISNSIDPVVSNIVEKALYNEELSQKDSIELFNTSGRELHILMLIADEIRRKTIGDNVTFVINHNINFTNVCSVKCRFCAFNSDETDSNAYLLTIDEIAQRAEQAWKNGSTEVCIQGGLHPKINGNYYANICRAIKERTPAMHIHAFSPMEIFYGAEKTGSTIRDYLRMLKESGLDSMPGTAAEILDDSVRREICPRKIEVKEWTEIIKTAHRLGIPTTSTIMYGHIDQPKQWARHLELLRDIQKETHGFTEFIPLSFIYPNTFLYKDDGARAGATGNEDIKMHAISRLMLNNYIENIQVSWVKVGPKLAQLCLLAGANDLGGTLAEESISKAAGATTGQRIDLSEIKRLIFDIKRVPAQRNTTYKILKVFSQ